MKKIKTKKLSIRRTGATGNRSRHFRPDVDGRTSSVPCLDEFNIDSFDLWQDTEAKDSRRTGCPVVELDSDRLPDVGYFCPYPFGICSRMLHGIEYTAEECRKCGFFNLCRVKCRVFIPSN